jgi:hypothetical protein
MHSIQVIKNACVEAIEGEEDNPGGLDLFRAVVDPESVWEMARIIEAVVDRLDQSGVDPELVTRVRQQLSGGFASPDTETLESASRRRRSLPNNSRRTGREPEDPNAKKKPADLAARGLNPIQRELEETGTL